MNRTLPEWTEIVALDTAAPWAEPVLHTAEDLLALADDSWRYELVQGQLVRMPPTNLEHSDIAGNLFLALRSFVDARGLGRVTMPETGFVISDATEPDTVLAPDLAFIRAGRIPESGAETSRAFPRLAPDLVIEIASPSQHRPEMAAKARLWLSAGTHCAWVIWPVSREVDVWVPGKMERATLTDEDILRGDEILPGFELPIRGIW
jgi:Uma2 family endonuclease